MAAAYQESPWPQRWQRFSTASVRAFHAYANWLVGISWRRFILFSILLMVAVGILQDLPPFRWKYEETVASQPRVVKVPAPKPPRAPKAPTAPEESPIRIEKQKGKGETGGLDISIDEHGVRITPRAKAAASAASAASAGLAASATGRPADEAPQVDIQVPAGAHNSEAVKEAVEEARRTIRESIQQAREDARQAARDAAEAARDAAEAARAEAADAAADAQTEVVFDGPQHRTRIVKPLGDALPQLAALWILASLVIKVTYKRQIQAEAQAAQAVETAEAEALKRQVVEARMAAMQAQVEPHFLFNTLASIDHLIEVDPKRASQMQKNLIALLRASMPTMREANDGGVRDLGRELSVIRPYLEILKVRMEERLTTDIDVPEGLVSAEFPPMMMQTLVENAIKHGLEPKPEGGHLSVKAEIVHGKLAVSVTDTGLGFGRAATAGTGVGLANIRERLQLLYGTKAALTIAENPGGGTRATITVPYKPVEGTHA
ncbi:sensor histidine kinase [Aquabacterium sp.]|uniref:sensor histidine kinase n=1 Tax=Aquabacterium sp. TaxID=1872578 RepID=UPI0037832031